MVFKILVSALLVVASTFLTSPASAGFDEEGNLTLNSSTLKRAVEKGKGFWVKDARTGSKTRLVFSEFYGTDKTDHTFLGYENPALAQMQQDGTYRIHVSIFPENSPPDGWVQIQTAINYNLVALVAPRGFDKDGTLRITIQDLEKSFRKKRGIKIYDQRDNKKKKFKTEVFPGARKPAFGLLNSPDMVLTAKPQKDGTYRFQYSSPGWINAAKKINLAGTDFLDLKGTCIE